MEVVTDIKSALITDQELILRYDEEFKDTFFIPDSENKTYDDENLTNAIYVESSKKIGGQFVPISIAICDDDKFKTEESGFRIHGRIIDGRHRYLQAKAKGQSWEKNYYMVKNFDEYMLLRSHFDSKKKENPKEQIQKFKELADYKFKELGIPKQDIGKMIVDEYSPSPYSAGAIRNWLPDEYKDQTQAEKRKGKKKKIEETKKGKEIVAQLESEKDKQILEKDKQFNELKSTYQKEHVELENWRDREQYLLNEQIIKVDGTENELVKVFFNVNDKTYAVSKNLSID